MTPELKTACQVVFQEHKASPYPVTWNRDAFRGRISTGLSEMAKETLIKKNIIQFPNPSKKIITVLNPAALGAATYEEAEDIILNKIPAPVAVAIETRQVQPAVETKTRSIFVSRTVTHPVVRLAAANGNTGTLVSMAQAMPMTQSIPVEQVHSVKWYMRPVFIYAVWPVCAAIAGGFIAYIIGSAYTGLVFDLK